MRAIEGAPVTLVTDAGEGRASARSLERAWLGLEEGLGLGLGLGLECLER